jgi:hypothetical protein
MADQRTTPHGLPFAAVKIGVLIDIDMGTKDDFLATLRFPFDEAFDHGTIMRPVELVVREAIDRPRLEERTPRRSPRISTTHRGRLGIRNRTAWRISARRLQETASD